MKEEKGGRIGGNYEKIAKRKKAKFHIERICQYKDFARTAKEAGGYFGRSATTWKRNGDEEMAKLIEQKSDQLYHIVEHYEEKAAKASSELHRILGSLDPVMCRWRLLQIRGDFSEAVFYVGASLKSVFGDWDQTFLTSPLVCCL